MINHTPTRITNIQSKQHKMASFDMSALSITTERVVVDKKAENGVMLIKYNMDIHPRDLAFLRRFAELKTSTVVFHMKVEERLQDVIAFFQFLIDDVSGTEKRFYRLCEHKVQFRKESQPWAPWEFIGNDIARLLVNEPIHLLMSYASYSEVVVDETHIDSVKQMIHKLVDEHDFQVFTIECDEYGECDITEELQRESARPYIDTQKMLMMEDESSEYSETEEAEMNVIDEEVEKIERVSIVNTCENKVMLLKVPKNLDEKHLEFLKEFVKIRHYFWRLHDDAEQKVQEIEDYFKFITDDVSGPDKHLYKLCEQKVHLREEKSGMEWEYISDWCSFDYREFVDDIFDHYYSLYKMHDEHFNWTKSLYYNLMYTHDFQTYTIDEQNRTHHQNCLKFYEDEKKKSEEAWRKERLERIERGEDVSDEEESDEEEQDPMAMWNLEVLEHVSRPEFNIMSKINNKIM